MAVIVHDIYSGVKLMEVGSVVFQFPQVTLLVISKASSSAAQSGVPDIEKRAFLLNRRVLFVPDLKDAIDILNPDRHYMVTPKKLSKGPINFSKIREELDKGLKVVISVSGGDSSFTLKELEYGEPVDLGFEDLLPPSASIAIILYKLFLERE